MCETRTATKNFSAHLPVSFSCADETATKMNIAGINQFVFITTVFDEMCIFMQLKFSNFYF